MLDLTGEEQEITVTDSTVITKQSMGGGQGAPGGEAPEKPDGEARMVTVRHQIVREHQMLQVRPKRLH
ncbi:MAG: hypothetical protein ACLU3F_14480 [Blautia wexlerae]